METERPRERSLAAFAFLWAFSILSHQVSYGLVRASLIDAALTAAALGVLVLPGRALLLGLLGGLHAATVYYHLPAVFNHEYFAGLVSLSLLLGCAVAWRNSRGTGAAPLAELAYAASAPALRWCLVLLYFLSGFHKLNADFFDPAISCASELFQRMSTRLGGLPDIPVAGPFSIAFTITAELGIPVLLLAPRLRRAGVGIGIVFHLAMAAAGYARFSAVGLALLTLFLPPGLLTVRPAIRAVALVVLLPAVALASRGGGAPFFWATIVLSLVMLVLVVARPWPRAERRDLIPEAAGRPAMIAPVLLLLSSLAPYAGLGTDRALSMYSNLRTEGGESNHFLIPAGIQPFSHQRDLVQVLGSSVPRLDRLAANRLALPFTELRARLSEEISTSPGPVSVTYLRAGTRFDVPSARADSGLDLPVSRLQLKFMRFRPVEARGPRRCGV